MSKRNVDIRSVSPQEVDPCKKIHPAGDADDPFSPPGSPEAASIDCSSEAESESDLRLADLECQLQQVRETNKRLMCHNIRLMSLLGIDGPEVLDNEESVLNLASKMAVYRNFYASNHGNQSTHTHEAESMTLQHQSTQPSPSEVSVQILSESPIQPHTHPANMLQSTKQPLTHTLIQQQPTTNTSTIQQTTLNPTTTPNMHLTGTQQPITISTPQQQSTVIRYSNITPKSISPGGVETELVPNMAAFRKAGVALLYPEDVANAILYALSTPPHIQVHELMIRAMGAKA